MKKRKLGILVAAIGLVMMFSVTSAASIIGETLRIEWEYTPYGGVFTSTDAIVVDPGVEWSPSEYGVSVVDIAEDSIIIGDDLDVDIIGARNIGMDGVYFNSDGKLHNEEVSFEIRSLKELTEIF